MDDINYILYEDLWDHFDIEDIHFNFDIKTKLFETKLYYNDPKFDQRLYFTRFLNLEDLLETHNKLEIEIPYYIKAVLVKIIKLY